MIRTRFAPSPTGYLHVGSLRSALYNYLFAKHNGGKFLLRIEDTDRERYVADGVKNIVESLSWAHVIPDEGVRNDGDKIVQVGEKGPYIQSERLPIYKKYSEELIKNDHAYYCFCTSERLKELREKQEKNKQPTGYDQFCLKNVTKDEAEKRIAAGEKHVVRLKMPKTGETIFNDLIRGEVRFKNELIDDQVLMKSDGFPTYHMAVVVDDHLMEITHVIRGEEWISSTPKHIQLYKYFGWTPPEFAHLPLLLNSDKSKLSKRQGDVAVADYAKKGYLPEALVNFVAFLGWNPGDDREIFSLDELVKEFDFKKVNKTGAVFNLEKLDWFNKEYLKKMSLDELRKIAMPFFLGDQFYKNFESRISNLEFFSKTLQLERERVTTLAELPSVLKFVFELPPYAKEQLVWKKGTPEEVNKILPELSDFLGSVDTWDKSALESAVMKWIVDKGYTNGSVLWPLRVALSGQEKSPGPYEIAEVLGKDESLRRLDVAINKTSN